MKITWYKVDDGIIHPLEFHLGMNTKHLKLNDFHHFVVNDTVKNYFHSCKLYLLILIHLSVDLFT